MTDAELIATLPARYVVGLTIYGEARSDREGIEGRIAIASVIRNRVTVAKPSFGLSPAAVCLKPSQFSCWNPHDGNYGVLVDAGQLLVQGRAVGPRLRECLWIADGMLSNRFDDNTHQATHYLSADLLASHPPAWTVGLTPVARIHSHVFFITD